MSEKRNIPELRFSGFDSSIWKHTALGEVCEMNPKSPSLPDNFVYIDLESVSEGRLLKEDHIEIHDAPSRAQRLLAKNDVIFQTVRPYQKNNLIFTKDGDYVASTGYAQLRPRENPSFLFQQIHTNRFVNDVLKRCTGTSYPAISSSDLGEVTFSIPSLPEQQKIAEFLTAVDKRIELLQTKKEKLESYKKGVMQKIFSQQLRFKADDGSEFPDWEERKLGDLGITFNGLTGKSKENFGQGKPYIQYKQIFDSSEIKPDGFGLVEVGVEESQSRVQRGDVFFTTSSETPHEIGMASVLTTEVGEVYLNSFCFGYRPSSTDVLIPEFSRYFFRSPAVRKGIVKLAQGSTRYNMSKVELMKLSFLLPKPEEQQKIAKFLTSLDSTIDNLNQQINQTQTWKKGLLQKMFV